MHKFNGRETPMSEKYHLSFKAACNSKHFTFARLTCKTVAKTSHQFPAVESTLRAALYTLHILGNETFSNRDCLSCVGPAEKLAYLFPNCWTRLGRTCLCGRRSFSIRTSTRPFHQGSCDDVLPRNRGITTFVELQTGVEGASRRTDPLRNLSTARKTAPMQTSMHNLRANNPPSKFPLSFDSRFLRQARDNSIHGANNEFRIVFERFKTRKPPLIMKFKGSSICHSLQIWFRHLLFEGFPEEFYFSSFHAQQLSWKWHRCEVVQYRYLLGFLEHFSSLQFKFHKFLWVEYNWKVEVSFERCSQKH